jgi:hypothetical protein
VKLIRIDRGGRRGDARAYESADKRFRVLWQKKQGARSCYSVHDQQTKTTLRASTLEEVRETIRDMLANDRLSGAPDPYLEALIERRVQPDPAADLLCTCGHRRSDHGGDYLHCRLCPHGGHGIASVWYRCAHFVRVNDPPLLLTEFVAQMHEIMREAKWTHRQCPATPMEDARGRNIALYYADLMERLDDAVDLVNERISTRGKT